MLYPLMLGDLFDYLEAQETYILLESSLPDKDNYLSYIFTQPQQIIACYEPKQALNCLKKIQKSIDQGNYAAGFLSYEAGYALIDKLNKLQKKKYDFPLIWMGVFNQPIIFNHCTNKFSHPFKNKSTPARNNLTAELKLKNKHLNTTCRQYLRDIKNIKKFIENGDTYQVNHTLKYKFDSPGSPQALYQALRKKQPVNYSAFINSSDFKILSFSPELFFKLDKNKIKVKPMKGTAPRGITPALDQKNKRNLRLDKKNRAENIMIVDLLRNDLGKISQTGTVKVTDLFKVEDYPTLFQMTSTIESKLKKHVSFFSIFSSLFPSGSITGAPKIHTMEIIKRLEAEARKIYTGSIGFFSPQKKAVFNIAIRTVLLEKNKKGKGEMGIGSGITYSSKSNLEYQECLLKADFLKPRHFKIIETMLLKNRTNILFLDAHLKRMQLSAKFFAIPFFKTKILKKLNQSVLNLPRNHDFRIRLLLDMNGAMEIQTPPIDQHSTYKKQKIAISKVRTNPKNIFLYHKTTKRKIYDQEFKKYYRAGFFDAIFLNKNNKITEGAISNIFIKKNGLYFTPPIDCGLLPGIYREYFLNKYPKKAKEKILYINDLKTADKIYCANSVRGMVEVVLKTG